MQIEWKALKKKKESRNARIMQIEDYMPSNKAEKLGQNLNSVPSSLCSMET